MVVLQMLKMAHLLAKDCKTRYLAIMNWLDKFFKETEFIIQYKFSGILFQNLVGKKYENIVIASTNDVGWGGRRIIS